ncbi:MAG: hypothetical protein PF961_13305 [Planctomycetota bacterium]|nr:hypothetical protein [Planctomycetota bacterium]
MVCPHCVDTLPTDAQVRINQMRALRGMDTTPYRFRHPALPEAQLFTYTTSAQVMRHRRLINDGKQLDAPSIGPRSGPSEPILPRQLPTKSKGPTRLIMGLAGGGLVLLVLILVTVIGGSPSEQTNDEPAIEPDGGIAVPAHQAMRRDYPQRTEQAWPLAADELPIDHPVLAAIAREVIELRSAQLDRAEAAITEGETAKAQDLLARFKLAPHPLLNQIERRDIILREQLADALTQQATPEPISEPKPEPQAPAPRPPAPVLTPPETITDTAPEPAPEPAPATPLPAPAASNPTVIISGASLLLDEDPGWATDGSSLVLNKSNGTVTRTLALSPGAYQVWLAVTKAPDEGRLIVGIAQIQVPLTPPDKAGWLRISTEALTLSAQEELTLSATGNGWQIAALALVMGDSPPNQIEAQEPRFVAPRALPSKAPPAESEIAVTVTPLELVFSGEAIALNATSPGVPTNLPGGIDTVYAPPAAARRELTLKLGGVDASAGGFALLVHPLAERRRLGFGVELRDRSGQRLELPIIPTADSSWQTLLIDTGSLKQAGFNLSDVHRLTLHDTERNLALPFMLGAACVVSGRPPQVADLDLQARALAMPSTRTFQQLLARLAQARGKGAKWYSDLDPQSFHVLVGHQLLTSSWRGAVYDRLEDATGKRPRGLLSALVMHDAWLDDTFMVPRAILDKRFHLVVVATGGIEFATGLSSGQALGNFWDKMLAETIASGILPVVVLGPTKIQAEHQIATEAMWEQLEKLVQRKYPGVPIIDLRSVGPAPYESFGPGQGQTSALLLSNGILEFQGRMDGIQAAVRDKIK